MNLLNSYAQIILGRPKNALKPFRASAAPSEPQLTRDDGALVLQTHLIKHSTGYRLMFWHYADGMVEFANVGVKHELIIH